MSLNSGSNHRVPAPEPPPRRILFMDHTARMGGGEIALLNLVRSLDPRRYHPIVLLFSSGPLQQHLARAGIQSEVLPLNDEIVSARKDTLGKLNGNRLSTGGRLRQVRSIATYLSKLAGFIRSNRIDLVHTNSLKSDVLGGLAGRMARTPVLWHVRDRIADDYLPRRTARIFRMLGHLLPRGVIANSGATLKTLDLFESNPRIPPFLPGIPSRMQVVHDGLDPAEFAAEADDAQDLRESDLTSEPLIGLVGRITRWKGQHVFIEAASIVHERFPNARFQIIGSAMFGEDAYEQEIRARVKQRGLENIVHFLGFRADVQKVISRLDVLVHASITGEPFGQVLIEAMTAGKPVVATNGGGVPEIVVDGVTGFLVPMNDAAAMAERTCRLLASPKFAGLMGAMGRQRVLEHFTIQNTAEKVQRIYEQMLGANV